MNRVAYTERQSVYRAALRAWGQDAQVNKFVEELGEFLVEFSRMRNGGDNKEAFAEELADLTIMLEQLRLIYDVNDEVCAYMDYKIRRLQSRAGSAGR